MKATPRTKKCAHLVMCALGDLSESQSYRNGVSATQLTDFISSEYDLPSNYRRHVTAALERGVEFGAIEKRRGKYYLGELIADVRRRQKGSLTTLKRRLKHGKKRKHRKRERSHSKKRRHRRDDSDEETAPDEEIES